MNIKPTITATLLFALSGLTLAQAQSQAPTTPSATPALAATAAASKATAAPAASTTPTQKAEIAKPTTKPAPSVQKGGKVSKADKAAPVSAANSAVKPH